MKASTRRILLWLLGISVTIVALGAMVLVNIAVQLSGGWDEVFDTSHPQASDSDVVAARQASGRAVDEELRDVLDIARPALTAARVAQPSPTGEAALDEPALGSHCETGQHNWKIDDPYDLACVEVRRAVVAAGESGFRSDMVALDRALVAAGWTPSYDGGLPGTLEYWDQFAGAFTASPSGDDVYGPEDLPSAGYRSRDGRFTLSLGFGAIPLYTGQPAAELADGEFALLVGVSTQSVSE